jgi:pilus assembly protein CpaE
MRSPGDHARKSWTSLVVCPNRTLRDELVRALRDAAGLEPAAELSEYPAESDSFPPVGLQIDLCFIDVGSSRLSGLGLVRRLAGHRPPLPVVAINQSNDAETILESMRQGASEYLCSPLHAESVRQALARLAALRQAAGTEPPEDVGACGIVHAVIPGKPGSGATTLACYLALELAKQSGRPALLADLDPFAGTVSFVLKLRARFSFLDAFANAGGIDDDLWKGLVTPWHGIDVLIAPDDPTELVTEPANAPEMIQFWRRMYGHVVLDLPGAFDGWSTTVARCCDELLVVTGPGWLELETTRRALSRLHAGGIAGSKISVILNRGSEAQRQSLELHSAIGAEVAAVLPEDEPAICAALMHGKPLAPNSPLHARIAELAARAEQSHDSRALDRGSRRAWWKRALQALGMPSQKPGDSGSPLL